MIDGNGKEAGIRNVFEHDAQIRDRRMPVEAAPDVPVRGMKKSHGRKLTASRRQGLEI